ncbi:unnamed protein product [Didymodactylos carnosus]|uniref:Chlorophyllase n=1 Tax=Didymodactylos carnosus TaxID=1234261 RepID=A0A8S2F8G3_9BILA|nr:unnamed protein product [Didymodactylos carnosus]CAF4179880.1 unnamed protein product [Didymodactylos carnosus]
MKLAFGAVLFYSVVTAYSVTIHWSVPSITSFNVDIYTTTDDGIYPVIIFMTGFEGLVPASFYSNLLTKIADQKIIVIAVSQIQNITAEYVEKKFTQFMIFITNPTKGAKKLFKNNPLTKTVIPDIENQLAFLAHSAGCHVLTLYLTKRCGTKNAQVKLFVMMDPVDGYVTHPPAKLSFNTSVLIMSTGLDARAAYPGEPACAPDSMSNNRFYQCLSGPKWLLNFTNYGHADMLDEPARVGNNIICSTCSQLPIATTCNYEKFRQDEANAIVNFTQGILNGINGQQQLQFLQQPQLYFSSRVTIKPNIQEVKPSNGFCQHYP